MASLPEDVYMARDEYAEVRADECDRLAAYHEHMATLIDGPLASHLILEHKTDALVFRARAEMYRKGVEV